MACELTYNISITGDCTNTFSGGFTIDIVGSAPPYTIQWLSPITDVIPLGVDVTTYNKIFLTAGTYSFNIIDSCSTNTVLPVNVLISSGTCTSIDSHTDTLCGLNNGSLTASTTYSYGNATFSLYENTLGLVGTSSPYSNVTEFSSLSPGTYYVIADDGAGCTGRSETCIVKSSTTINYDLFVVDNAGCTTNSGKIFVSGLTGNPPYSYLWSNGQIGDSITGLTEGTYSVTVTDNTGCGVSKSATVELVNPVSIGSLFVVQPSCFISDGEVTVVVVDGTAPFYYLASNGDSIITFDRTVVFTNLPPGGFTVEVTDAGLCKSSSSTTLLTPAGISSVSVTTTNSQCNDLSGVLKITVLGGTPPFIYTLTDSNGNSTVNTITSNVWEFQNLSSGDYQLTITDLGPCTYSNTYTINNVVLFGLTTTTTGTSCGGNDGSVTLNITSGGIPPYTYSINSQTVQTSLLTYTFSDLSTGDYIASVVDSSNCYQSIDFRIDNSVTVDFHLLGVDSVNNSGSISAYITDGTPPFTLFWSNNVNGQTGMTVTNLSAGTYSLRVEDSNGCSKTKEIIIKGTNIYNSSGSYNVCSGDLLNGLSPVNTGPREMLNEGFYDLTSGYTNCILNSATYILTVIVGDFETTSEIYTSTNLNDYPSDSYFFDSVKTLVESSPQIGVGNVETSINNTITIKTNCNPESLQNSDVVVSVRLNYDISCQYCNPAPSLTPTPTITPTITPTPTLGFTPTPTVTPTYTPTPTSSPITIYYAYRECNGDGESTVILQPMLALPDMVIGDTVLFMDIEGYYSCWELINNTGTLSQYLGLYLNTYNSETNYFTEVDGNIYDCEICVENALGLNNPTPSECTLNFSFINYSVDDGYGSIYLNGNLIYQWFANSPLVNYSDIINVVDGDVITIDEFVGGSLVDGFATSTNGTIYQTINTYGIDGNPIILNNTITSEYYYYNYVIRCGDTPNTLDIRKWRYWYTRG